MAEANNQSSPDQSSDVTSQTPDGFSNQAVSAPQNSQPSPEQPQKKKPNLAKVFGVVIVVILVFGMIGSCSDDEISDPEPSTAQTQASVNASNEESATEPNPSSSNDPVEKTPQVDKSELRSSISTYSVEDLSLFTDETAQEYESAYSSAEEALSNPDATQDEIDAAKNALEAAYNALLIKPFDKNDYETLVYKDVARNPDSFVGSLVKCSGNVLQVMESDDETDVRLATDGDYDDIVFVGFDPSILDVRVLEDDNITVYGTCIGLYTYTATLGQEISLPAIYATKVEINE